MSESRLNKADLLKLVRAKCAHRLRRCMDDESPKGYIERCVLCGEKGSIEAYRKARENKWIPRYSGLLQQARMAAGK